MAHPMQPLVKDPDGVVRFKINNLVRHLVDNHPGGLSNLTRHDTDKEDYAQLMQLIGYSVSAFGELSGVGKAVKDLVDYEAEQMRQDKRRENLIKDTIYRQGFDAGRASAFQDVKDAIRDIDDA